MQLRASICSSQTAREDLIRIGGVCASRGLHDSGYTVGGARASVRPLWRQIPLAFFHKARLWTPLNRHLRAAGSGRTKRWNSASISWSLHEDDNKSRRPEGPRAHLELRGNGAAVAQRAPPSFNGVFLLILLNIGLFIADHVLQIPLVRLLYLDHSQPRWYQFVTATFCHASWSHLSSNLFALYIAGKLVEEEEGSFGVWASYLITGLGANVVSWLLLPRACVSVGASGAVFGLYAVSVLVKIGWDWRKILEVLILGQFVVEKVLSEVHMAAAMGGAKLGAYSINHVAHLAGALAGVALIWLITRIPAGEPSPVKDLSSIQDDQYKPLG